MVDDSKNSHRISIVTWCKCPHVSRTRIFEVSAMEGIAVRFATKLSPQCSQNTDTWLLLEGLLNKQIHNTTHARAFPGQFNCAVCIEWAVCSLQVQRWHATTQLIVFAYFATRTKQKLCIDQEPAQNTLLISKVSSHQNLFRIIGHNLSTANPVT